MFWDDRLVNLITSSAEARRRMRINRGRLLVLLVAAVSVAVVVAWPPKRVVRRYLVEEGIPTGDGGQKREFCLITTSAPWDARFIDPAPLIGNEPERRRAVHPESADWIAFETDVARLLAECALILAIAGLLCSLHGPRPAVKPVEPSAAANLARDIGSGNG